MTIQVIEATTPEHLTAILDQHKPDLVTDYNGPTDRKAAIPTAPINQPGREDPMTIEPGRYTTNRTQEWWDDPRLSDTARAWAVATALELPEDVVEVVADSDEEVDLASVWIVTDDHERAIGHVTTDPDGTIVVEVLDDIEPQELVLLIERDN